MADENPSPEEVLECLGRSGYLLESRLVRLLTEERFFVEANSVVKDPRTGKSREIDLIAEADRYAPEHQHCCVKTTLVVEAVNNRYPFVLLTPWSWTPLSTLEYRAKFIVTPQSSPFGYGWDIDKGKGLITADIYSQFCVLSRKSGTGPLMASHPDDIYGSLLKSAEYIEQQIAEWEDRNLTDEYWRIFFWQPVLVLSGQLLAAEVDESGEVVLRDISSAQLAFNWHSEDRAVTTIFFITTEAKMPELVRRVLEDDYAIESKLHAFRCKRGQGELEGNRKDQ